jgi:hypothetical protein
MEPPRIPSEKDWGNYKADLDQEDAHKVFSGKTLEEVIPDFERSVIERTAELRFMPAVPFRYYMLAFRNFVLSPSLFEINYGWGAPDAASCFLDLVVEKLEEAPEVIGPIMRELIPAIEHVALNQVLYEADEDIYGSFTEKLARIHELYKDI